MFKKIIKRGQRKFSKLEVNEGTVYGYGVPDTVNVAVNHASRVADPGSPKVNSPPLSMALSAAGVIELLPLLKDAPPPERPLLFSRKLQICCASFDFSNTLKSIREKEIKRQTLLEVVDIVQSGFFKLSESVQQELVWMISVNIFRCFPPAPHENTASEAVDPDEEDQYSEPSWPHLQLVYELLLRYVVSPNTDIKIAKRYIDNLFVLKFLELFDSEDPREREYLKAILHRTYGKFMVLRPLIRQAISNVFYRFIFETERHRGIGELLEVLGSIINGFALPMKQEHKLFLARALMPLHKPKMISSYHHQLLYCVVQFVEKDSKLAEIVIKRLLKYWPMTNCQKEVLFLGELENVLEATQSAEFQSCMVPLFRQIGRCLNSPHFQVAERALFFWNNEHVVSLVAQNRNVILPIIFEPLEQNLRGHWSQAIHGLTINVQKMFMVMDMELFQACQSGRSEREAQARESEARRETAWKWMEDVVASQGGECRGYRYGCLNSFHWLLLCIVMGFV